ncbi:hypothetical protein G0U57_019955, partial [Chelydra serpentina]
ARDLADLVFPSRSTLVQYVDDLLLCSPSLSASETDSLVLLTALANKGHKASRSKLQLCQASVTYFGFLLSQGSSALSPTRVQAILSFPRRCSPRQVRKFLGMAGFCRQWIPQYASLAKPLQELTRFSVPDPMPWPPKADSAFVSLKQGLVAAPALGLPDYSKPFTLFCHEQSGCALGVLTQMRGEKNRRVAYFFVTLDPVAQGLPPCLRAVADAARLVEMSDSLVLTRYELLLVSASYITVKRCSQLNPATLLPLSNDGDPHDCLATVSAVTVPRSDLSDVPLPNSDLVLFTDGSCFQDNQGRLLAGYAVVSLSETLEAAPLPSVTSAQVAELVALTHACFLADGRSATTYTDSRYAFGVVHDFGTLRQTRGFLTSAGTPIKNGPYITALLYAVLLPSALAIVKCPGHSMADTDVAMGNAFADASAKHAAAIEPSPDAFLGSLSVSIPPPSLTDLTLLQDSAPETEKESWVAHGCSLHPDSL